MSSAPLAPEDLAAAIETALDDGKAVDVRALAVGHLTVIADFMIIASGRSARQVRALTDRVREAAREHGASLIGVEGEASGEWVLIDAGDVIVHIMQPATRDFYQLEKLWESEPTASRADQR